MKVVGIVRKNVEVQGYVYVVTAIAGISCQMELARTNVTRYSECPEAPVKGVKGKVVSLSVEAHRRRNFCHAPY